MENRKRNNEEDFETNVNLTTSTHEENTSRFKNKRRKQGELSLGESFEYSFENGCKVGKCKLCAPEKNITIKMKDSNTTGIKRHLRDKHPDVYAKTYTSNDVLSKSNKQTFNQDVLNSQVVDWIAMKYLPFSFFDDERSQEIFNYLNPNVDMPLRKKLHSLTMERYSELEKVVLKILQTNNSKISFTLDGWTSIANRSYYGVTAHFVDEFWKLHSLVLFFIPSKGKHTGKEIAEVFFKAVHESQIEDKIEGITLDNASNNTTFMAHLSQLLKFNKTDKHFKCYAHIVHLGAQDLLNTLKLEKSLCTENEDELDGNIEDDKDGDNNVNEDDESRIENIIDYDLPAKENFPLVKLRQLFKVIKLSEQWRIKLENCCNITEEKFHVPNMDVSTRWNSTFAMIQTALKMQRALLLICELNEKFKKYLITEQEWTLLRKVFQILKSFKELTEILSEEKYPTLSLVVTGFNLLLDIITKHIDKLNAKPETDMTMSDCSILEGLKACFNKLMKHYQKSNWMYCAVLILDPRFKVERFYQTSWGKEMVSASLKKFETMYKSTYYTPKKSTDNSVRVENLESSDDSEEEESLNLSGFFKNNVKEKNNSQQWRKELDYYLAQPCADAKVNILEWWSQNEKLYPTLSLMARDLFSIQATSVPSERLFSRGSLTIRKHRNRLNNESIKYLMCLNSWVSCSLADKIQSMINK